MQKHGPDRSSLPSNSGTRPVPTAPFEPAISPHARRRQEQRGITPVAIDAALRWGRRERQLDGREAFHLGRRSVRQARSAGADVGSFENVAVVVASDGVIVTVFRSPDTRRLRRRRR